MRNLRYYLDTSTISHLFHDDVPQRKAETEEFFDNVILPGHVDAFISAIVFDELNRTRNAELRSKLVGVISAYPLVSLPDLSLEVRNLAKIYMEEGILPSKKPDDALHVAYATIYEMDVLVTWNFRHLARVQTTSLINGVNMLQGFTKPLRLLTPLEVLVP